MPENTCLRRVLEVGDAGPCVRYLQELLRERGRFTGAVDGVMGEGTSQALKRFQQHSGLEPTGKTEPVTWEVLTSQGVPATPPPRQRCRLLRAGAEGPDVALVQEKLAQLGFDPGAADGVFGPGTEQAVRRWQQASGLPVNGVIGRRAWDSLGIACQELDQSTQHQLAPTLGLGDQGRAVVLLQALLLAAGFDPGAIDGVYGSLTAAAVGAVQRATGLPATQCADRRLWAALGLQAEDQPEDPHPTPRLRYGSRGRKVKDLQILLLETGFDPGDLDGVFGQQVQAAVYQLQTALEIPLTGKMGWVEWEALGIAYGDPGHAKPELAQVLATGDHGAEVEVLQRLLQGIGYDPGSIDGVYGPLTESAVMLLQRSEGLPITGLVDAPTWNALT